ncbi:hypothetical protein BDV40DRAFT_263618 [Aspergillus tamarii]|uniref:Uncharacterized protein n=1 Tax=Aspergillus tamarii TaxID=41984 RepID=A0A5N6UWR9_ASPTM|nr:hypothetical protein BDV40DRAFT_263618 [Aspergillus tamarii]
MGARYAGRVLRRSSSTDIRTFLVEIPICPYRNAHKTFSASSSSSFFSFFSFFFFCSLLT